MRNDPMIKVASLFRPSSLPRPVAIDGDAPERSVASPLMATAALGQGDSVDQVGWTERCCLHQEIPHSKVERISGPSSGPAPSFSERAPKSPSVP